MTDTVPLFALPPNGTVTAAGRPSKKTRLSGPRLSPAIVTEPSPLGVMEVIDGGPWCTTTTPYGKTNMSFPKSNRTWRGPKPENSGVKTERAKAPGELYAWNAATEKPGTVTN